MLFFPSVTRNSSRFSPFTGYIGRRRISVADYFRKWSQRLNIRAKSRLPMTSRETSHLPNAAGGSVDDHSKCFHSRSLSALDHWECSGPPHPCTILNSERFVIRTPCYKNIIELRKSPGLREFPTINPEKLRRHCVFDHSQLSKTRSGRVLERSQFPGHEAVAFSSTRTFAAHAGVVH